MTEPESLEIDVLVVGSGVVGLAVAAALSALLGADRAIAVVDKHAKFGQEASSHNSEVVHAGLYYPPGSYKAEVCVRGRELLYSYCATRNVPHARCGKHIVAFAPELEAELEKLFQNGMKNGVPLERCRYEGRQEAIWSPTTGIVDSHSLMAAFEQEALGQGVSLLYRTSLASVENAGPGGATVRLNQPDGTDLVVRAKLVVNCGGLGATRNLALLEPDSPWTVQPCRGRYYSLRSRWRGTHRALLYPLPDPRGGLGVHLTIDLAGECRLGPDVDWSAKDHPDPQDMALYQHDDTDELRARFFTAGRKLLPDLREDDLLAGYVGVRAKLFREGKAHPEFVLHDSRARSSSLHLLGIESPGLTASLALAEDVARLASELFA